VGSDKPSEDDPLVKNSTDDVMDQAQISESSNNPMTLEQVNSSHSLGSAKKLFRKNDLSSLGQIGRKKL
jgi:hypothetical protein